MVHHSLAMPLQRPVYEPFTSITRCLHFNDFLDCWSEKSLLSRRLYSRINYTVHNASLQVLWFAPSKPETEHNFYGNVSFTIPWDQVLARFHNFYYIDQSRYDIHAGTRIILTKSRLNGVDPVSCASADCPPLVREDQVLNGRVKTTWKHATECFMPNRIYPHELEIAILVSPEDCVWFFRQCKLRVNNHSHANKGSLYRYEPHICHRYNMKGYSCPDPDDNESSVRIVREWFKEITAKDYATDRLDCNDRAAFERQRTKPSTMTAASLSSRLSALIF